LLKNSTIEAFMTTVNYSVPEKIDSEISALKLKAMGVKIDTLTAEQVKYLASWQEGT